MFNFLIYNKLKLRKWRKLSPEQRLNVYQQIERIEAKKAKRRSYTLYAQDFDFNGLCRSRERAIDLHVRFLQYPEKRFLGMATLMHECRHAFQDHVVESTKKFRMFSRASRWKKNMQGYLDTYNSQKQSEFSFYEMQPIERDANRYAIKRLKRMWFRYRKEPDFHKTLKYREDSYEEAEDKAIKRLGIFYKFRVAFRSWKKRSKRK